MTVTVVIPALNEEGNVGRLIHETFRVLPRDILCEMIVIDDGSSDQYRRRDQIPYFEPIPGSVTSATASERARAPQSGPAFWQLEARSLRRWTATGKTIQPIFLNC